MKRNPKGFTLIELLIVVAIIGIIVAIAIPNLLNAIQRAKQRRTMGDIRSASTAVEAYAVDLNRYPPAAGSYDLPFAMGTTTMNVVRGYLSPTYIKSVPLAGRLEFLVPVRHGRHGIRLHLCLPRQGRCDDGGRRGHPRRCDDRLQRGHRLQQRFLPAVARGRPALTR